MRPYFDQRCDTEPHKQILLHGGRELFFITYTKVYNHVNIDGFNPDNPSEPLEEVITFETEKDAEGFCLTVATMECAIESCYNGKFALGVDGSDTVDITTETPLSRTEERLIRARLQQVIDLGVLPWLKHVSIEPF